MNCVECRAELVAHLEGLLEAACSRQVADHVAACRSCRAELEALMEIQGRLERDGKAPPEASLEPAVMDRILRTQAFKIRRTTMIKRMLAWGATVAAVVVMTLVIVAVPWKSTAYALAQSVEAGRGLKTVHVTCDPPAGGVRELWAQFDKAGGILLGRVDLPNSEDGPKIVIWRHDVAQVVFKAKNSVLTLREPKALKGLETMIRTLDPKETVERLYEAQAAGKDDVRIDLPAAKGDLVRVTQKVRRDGEDGEDVYTIDPETKLLRQLDKYRLNAGGRQRLGSIVIAEYNAPIDPSVFAPDLPADATRIDWTAHDVGLPQGHLTAEEVAAQLVREFFEALIARDYAKAGQLYAGMPAAKMEKVFGGFTFLEIVSIGDAVPTADGRPGILDVPCEVRMRKGDAEPEVMKCQAKVRPVQGQPGRWAIDGGI
jgi:hypothetical protein